MRRQTIHLELNKVLGYTGCIARYTLQNATMYTLDAANAQRTGALIQLDYADAHFAGHNWHRIEQPANVHRQIAFVC